MMELAENLLVENSRYRKDVPDALIRQPHTDLTKAYTKHEIPGLIYLSDFDLGKNGFAYADKDVADYNLSTGSFQAWNAGWSYRNDGVDIQANTDETNSNGFHVGFTEQGEWIKYTVNVKKSAVYRLKLRVATELANSKFHLSIGDQSITSSSAVQPSGAWDIFDTHIIENIILEEGMQELKIYFDQGSINVSSLEFIEAENVENLPFSFLTAAVGENERSVKLTVNKSILEASIGSSADDFIITVNGQALIASTISLVDNRTVMFILDEPILYTDQLKISYEGNSVSSNDSELLETFSDLSVINNLAERFVLPGKVEAEDYRAQEGLGLEETTDNGGGLNIGFTDAGDFAEYKIFVRNEGQYLINLRVASQDRTGRVGFYLIDEDDIETELIILSTPITGGWQTWGNVANSFYLPSGIYTLRMKVLTGGFNINWFDVKGITLSKKPEIIGSTLIYPNPTSRFININQGHFDKYVVISFSGARLASGIIKESEPIDLGMLEEGMYRLFLMDEKTSVMKSFNLLISNN
jgi:hypothetical protein